MNIKIKLLNEHAVIPEYATTGSAGFDLSATEEVTINPMSWVRVSTGLAFEIPVTHELQIRSRSGIAYRDGLIVHQAVGTIDSDYRGEVFVMLRNVGLHARTVKIGQRIAQGIIAPVDIVGFDVVDDLRDSERGSNGFGSTGL